MTLDAMLASTEALGGIVHALPTLSGRDYALYDRSLENIIDASTSYEQRYRLRPARQIVPCKCTPAVIETRSSDRVPG